MVRRPFRDFCSAWAMTALISLMPVSTALKEVKSLLVSLAIRRARVVFPQPGGPHSSMELRLSDSICTRSGLPGPRSFSWPINSSRLRGRMRSAKGCSAAEVSGSSGSGRGEKRLMVLQNSPTELSLHGWRIKRPARRLISRAGKTLAEGFVEKYRGSSGGVQGFDSGAHGDVHAAVSAANDF